MDGFNLVNAEMPFVLDGKEYRVKKANLQQVILFQRRTKEISAENDPSGDLRIAAYALFLVLNAADPEVTEDFVLTAIPGEIDVMEVLATLGFMNRQKVELMSKMREALLPPSTGSESSS